MNQAGTSARFFSASDVGQTRSSNQDFFGNRETMNLFIVADGMGGHAGGERASHLAVDTMLEMYDFGDRKKISVQDVKDRLKEAIESANDKINREALEDLEYQHMGTTVVALVIHGTQAVLAHVGDSRIYRLRDSRLEQMTRDHSLVQEQIDAGIISAEDSEKQPMKNVITRALGVESDVDIDFNTVKLREGDIFLLCTDGLHGMASDEKIAEILNSEPDPENCCNKLVALANAGGGTDNVTATVIKVRNIAPERSLRPLALFAIPAASAICAGLMLFLLTSVVMRDPSPSETDEGERVSVAEVVEVPEESAGSPETPPETGAVVSEPAVSEPPAEIPESPEPALEPALEPEPEDEIEAEIARLREALGGASLSVDARVETMLALVSAQMENESPEQARATMQKLFALCIDEGRGVETSDIEDPDARSMWEDLQAQVWAEWIGAAEEKIRDLRRRDADVYASREFETARSALRSAERALEAEGFFSALGLLDAANAQIEKVVRAGVEKKLEKKRDAEKQLARADRELEKVASYRGGGYEAIRAKVEQEEARLRQARLSLKDEGYEESIRLAGLVIKACEEILSDADAIEKEILAVEEKRKDARSVAAEVGKMRDFLGSEEVGRIVAMLNPQAYPRLDADHKAFKELMKDRRYEEAVPSGRKVLADAKSLIDETSSLLKEKIAETDRALAGRRNSKEFIYDKTELDKAAEMLARASAHLERRAFSPAFAEGKKAVEFVRDMQGEPRLGPSELKTLADASAEAGTLAVHLNRCIQLLAEHKRSMAKDLLLNHSRKKFEALSQLISEDHEGLGRILDDVRRLCFAGESLPPNEDLETALESVGALKQELDSILIANGAV